MIRHLLGHIPVITLLTLATASSQFVPISQANSSLTGVRSASFEITELRLWESRSGWAMGRLTIPDLDTTRLTQSGSRLRNYDRHVARLFETTYHQCQQNSALTGMNWVYDAANGNVNMGQFRIRCQTAREVVLGYGLSPSKAKQNMIYESSRGQVREAIAEILPLNIVGRKADRWVSYVQTIRPVFSPVSRQLETSQKFPTQRIQANSALSLPLRLPTEIPKLMKVADRFVVQSDETGYRICPATKAGQCDRSALHSFQQLTARNDSTQQDLAFVDPKTLPLGVIYRPIQLAHHTAGIYLENCVGQSCISVVQWRQDNILYEIQAQYREQPVLVKIANSAINSPPIQRSALAPERSNQYY